MLKKFPKQTEDFFSTWINVAEKNSTNLNTKTGNSNEANKTQDNTDQEPDEEERKSFTWNIVPGSLYQKDLNEADEQLVHWRKNVFMLTRSLLMKFLYF